MPENITPEEKLLRSIENPQKAQMIPAPAAQKSKPGLKNLSAFLAGWKMPDKGLMQQGNLSLVNKFVMSLAAVLTLFGIFDFMLASGKFNQRFSEIQLSSREFKIDTRKSTLSKLIDTDYPNARQGRDFFTFLSTPTVAAAADSVVNVKNLKLVGIIWSDNPQVMVENTSEQKTALLNVGDQINEFRVKKILRDKIVLEKEGREWELR
jgi:type II secretory pathway component PulC